LSLKFSLFLGIFIVLIFFVSYFVYALQPTFYSNQEIKLQITKGESFREIGGKLSRSNLIRSITVFKMYAFLTGRAQNFKPGIYNLNYSMNVPSLVKTLTLGSQNDVAVTIPEGSSVKDIEFLLGKAGFNIDKKIENFPLNSLIADYPFLNQTLSLEGFLFPDTYKFNLESRPEDIIRKMLDNFNKKAWPVLSQENDWYDTLILASLLEKEVVDFKDRQIVAGIILKRIKSGMPIQVDATISYIKCQGQLIGCKNLLVTKKDLKITSPYNTYIRTGWPPTPINNPGLEAIKAALAPERSSYWYYLSSRKVKKTIFSKNLEEHNLNRAKHL